MGILISNLFDATSIVIGLSGGVFSIRFREDQITILAVVYLLFAGVLGAVVIGHAGCDYFHFAGSKCNLLQLVGSTAADSLMLFVFRIAKHIADNPVTILKKYLNGKANKNGSGS